MSYKNEPYFPGDGGIVAQGEARRAAESARASAAAAGRHAAEVGEMAEKGLARTDDRMRDMGWTLSDLASRIQDLEHQSRVLFKQDEMQVAEIEELKGQASEVASVVVGLSKRLDASQEIQIEMIECLTQLKEALIAIGEHVAYMEAGSRDVMGIVQDILAEGFEGGLQGGKEGEEESVGLPHQTREFMKAVDVLCIEFRAYDNEAVRDFDFSTTPPQVKSDRKDNLEASSLREKRYQFAEMFHGNITEKMFRDFCLSIGGQNFIESHRIFYHELTKPLYNPTIKMICESIIQHQHIAQQHESVEHHAGV